MSVTLHPLQKVSNALIIFVTQDISRTQIRTSTAFEIGNSIFGSCQSHGLCQPLNILLFHPEKAFTFLMYVT